MHGFESDVVRLDHEARSSSQGWPEPSSLTSGSWIWAPVQSSVEAVTGTCKWLMVAASSCVYTVEYLAQRHRNKLDPIAWLFCDYSIRKYLFTSTFYITFSEWKIIFVTSFNLVFINKWRIFTFPFKINDLLIESVAQSIRRWDEVQRTELPQSQCVPDENQRIE